MWAIDVIDIVNENALVPNCFEGRPRDRERRHYVRRIARTGQVNLATVSIALGRREARRQKRNLNVLFGDLIEWKVSTSRRFAPRPDWHESRHSDQLTPKPRNRFGIQR